MLWKCSNIFRQSVQWAVQRSQPCIAADQGQAICSLPPAATLVETDIVIVLLLVLNAKVAFVVLASACKLLKCWLVFLLMLVLTATKVLVLQLTLTPKFNQPSRIH